MVDNTIALRLQSPELQSPLNRMARGLQMLAYKAQADTAQQTAAQNAMLNQAYSNAVDPTSGSVDMAKLRTALASGGAGAIIPTVESANAASITAQTNAAKGAFDLKREQIDASVRDISSYRTPTDAVAHLKRSVDGGLIDVKTAQTLAAEIPQDPAQFDAWKTTKVRSLLTAAQQLEQNITNRDMGNKGDIFATPKYMGGPPAGTVPGSEYAIAPKPGSGGDGKETFYGNIQFAQDKDGNTLMGQPSSKGGPIQWQLVPPELKVLLPTRTDDTGTALVTRYTLGGGEVSRTAKDLLGEALQLEVGKTRGAELAAAPAAVASGSRFLAQLEDLASDPNLERGTGLSSYFNFVRGSDGKSFQVKLDKATGSGFLEAISYLRNTGAISNTEGTAATASVSGLDAGLDAASFKKEIKILQNTVAKGLEKARANAAERDRILGITSSTGAPAPAPTGAGSNPADPLGLLGGE